MISGKRKGLSRVFLKRLPDGFSKKLLRLCLKELAGEVSSGVYAAVDGALRAPDATAYYALDTKYGLQSMSGNVYGPPEGNPAAVRFLTATLRKDPGLELKSEAVRRQECLEAVTRLDDSLHSFALPTLPDPVVRRVQQVLLAMLGACPDTTAIAYSAKHGPGTSIGCSYKESNVYFKYTNWPYGVTPRARPLLKQCILGDERWYGALEDSYRDRHSVPKWAVLRPDWLDDCLTDVSYNRVTTVPKDGTKDRPIAIEPTGNVYLQLGIEACLRSALRHFSGIDLDHQADVNRRLAYIGSTDQTPQGTATFDLSNASDTVSRSLCELLLPPAWFELLDCCRSPYGLLPDGSGWRYAKMSSMGNGYTFALESIVFYSLVRSISDIYGHVGDRKRISVFGDDLIFPRYLSVHVRMYLVAFGFQVNVNKSFTEGPVTESCGHDYWFGRNIRPAFIKTPLTVGHLVSLRNQLNGWWKTHMGDRLPLSIDSFLLSFYGGELAIGPDSVTDYSSYIHDSGFVAGHPYEVMALRQETSKLPGREFLLRKLMHSLRSCTGEGSTFDVTVRDSAKGFSLVARTVYGSTP